MQTPVMTPEDVLTTKLCALEEYDLDYAVVSSRR